MILKPFAKPTKVTIFNRSDFTMAEVRVIAKILERWTRKRLLPTWGVYADITVSADDSSPASYHSLTFIHSRPDPARLGVHYFNSHGAKAVVSSPSMTQALVTASHELAEMLVNPFLDELVLNFGAISIAKEICDPVNGADADFQGYRIANFVTPAWFRNHSEPPYDDANYLTAPKTLAPAGYALVNAAGLWRLLDKRGFGTIPPTNHPVLANPRALAVAGGDLK